MPNSWPDQLRDHLAAPLLASDFEPPPRFASCHFDNYEIDPGQPDQAAAITAIRAFVTRRARRFWPLARRRPPGLYLDGDFGVGKTHLLAAAWHAAAASRRYLSFAEAISLVIVHGPQRALQQLRAPLVCIDEFELDDPSNTRLADLLLDGLIRAGSRLVVTSNTVPGELGTGRFPVEDFRRQLGRISRRFTDIHVPGVDYRRRRHSLHGIDPARWGPQAHLPAPDTRHLVLTAEELDHFLSEIPILHLRRLARSLDALSIRNLAPFPDQFAALRFVHLIDRLYDYRVALHVQTAMAIDDCFLPSYRDWAFRKKYRRCTSRLHELCAGEPP